MTEPLKPLTAISLTPPQQFEGLQEALRRAVDDLPESKRPGVVVQAGWVQGRGASVALRVRVKDKVTLAVVAEKTYDDLRVFGEVDIKF